MFQSKMRSREVSMEDGILPKPQNIKPPTDYSADNLRDVAGFMNIDSDFWVFRRFGKLHLFNILRIQQKLIMLQYELERYEVEVSGGEGFDEIASEIQINLEKYDAALSAQTRFKSYKKPEQRLIDHIRSGVQKTILFGKPLGKALNLPLKDLASIAATEEKTWTHKFIDKHERLREIFVEDREEGALWSTLIYSEDNVLRAETIVIHAGFCFLLLGPIIGLYYLNSKPWKLLVLVLSLLAASVISVDFLNTPNKASLAFLAGYAAILVVFMSSSTAE